MGLKHRLEDLVPTLEYLALNLLRMVLSAKALSLVFDKRLTLSNMSFAPENVSLIANDRKRKPRSLRSL